MAGRIRRIWVILLLMLALLLPEAALAKSVTITVSAAGDCTLGGEVRMGGESRFRSMVKSQKNDYGYFLRLVKPYFDADDLTVVNLEGPLTTARKYKSGKKFIFRGSPAYAQILAKGGVELANLANNHTYDFYQAGYNSTKKALKAAGIKYFGGSTVSVRKVQGVKVGFAGFSWASEKTVLKTLKALNEKCDVMIVTFHWGTEYAHYPASGQIRLAHKVVDAGADLVIGHHPHVIQGIEKYSGKYIAYSLGNFCYGGHSNPPDKDCFILRCNFTLTDGVLKKTAIDVVPCSISSVKSRNNFQPKPLKGSEAARVMKRLKTYSKKFKKSGVPKKAWEEIPA